MSKDKVFRCLCVRAPWAGQIVDGEKLIEYRSTATKIRGAIGIIESKSGTIIGEAELYDCVDHPEDDCYYWHLRNAKRYKTPVPYEHPSGAVIWVKLPMKKRGADIAPAKRPGKAIAVSAPIREKKKRSGLCYVCSLKNGKTEILDSLEDVEKRNDVEHCRIEPRGK